MTHYIDADKLKERVTRLIASAKQNDWPIAEDYLRRVIDIIDSLQQDEKAVELDMCSQAYWEERGWMMIPTDVTLKGIESLLEQVRKKLQQEQSDVDLEKFTEKIKTFQERYKHPEIVSIKGAMAFMARMFYQYPNVARQWYESLPKVTMD